MVGVGIGGTPKIGACPGGGLTAVAGREAGVRIEVFPNNPFGLKEIRGGFVLATALLRNVCPAGSIRDK